MKALITISLIFLSILHVKAGVKVDSLLQITTKKGKIIQLEQNRKHVFYLRR